MHAAPSLSLVLSLLLLLKILGALSKLLMATSSSVRAGVVLTTTGSRSTQAIVPAGCNYWRQSDFPCQATSVKTRGSPRSQKTSPALTAHA